MKLFDANVMIGDLRIEAKEIELSVDEIKSLSESKLLSSGSAATKEQSSLKHIKNGGIIRRKRNDDFHTQEDDQSFLNLGSMGHSETSSESQLVEPQEYVDDDDEFDNEMLEKIDPIIIPEEEFHEEIENIFTELREDLVVREVVLEKQNYDMTISLRIDDYEDLKSVIQKQELKELKSYVVDVLVSCINGDVFSIEEYHIYVQLQDSKYDMDLNPHSDVLLSILPYDDEQ